MDNLKAKASNGVFWSFLDGLANQGVNFLLGLILARLLTPADFGLVGMVSVIVVLSQLIIDSGFSQAIIRKKNCSESDIRTVFTFNVLVSLCVYGMVYVMAIPFARFYDQEMLINLTRVVAISFVINAFGSVQTAQLQRDIDFKRQTFISLIASLVSGSTGVYLALTGFGVWSLVYRTLVHNFLNVGLLWYSSKWPVRFGFHKSSFDDLFGFGYKLMFAGIIDGVYQNLIYLVIGKVASPVELGYFNRAEQFKNLPSKNISNLVAKVSYPLLSKIDDPVHLKIGYSKIIRLVMLVTFSVMFYMVAISDAMILLLLGERWFPVSEIFRIIAVLGILYPLHALNLNILKVKGRSDAYLKLEVIKKLLAVPVILTGIMFGMKPMLFGMIVNSMVALYLNSRMSGALIEYSITEQLRHIAPIGILTASVSVVVFIFGFLWNGSLLIELFLQTFLFFFIAITSFEFTKNEAYIIVKNLVIDRIATIRK